MCGVCNKIITGRRPLVKHYKEEHSGLSNPNMCYCGKIFHSEEAMKTHKKVHMVTCDICGTILGGNPSLRKHMQIIHESMERYECSTCGKSYKSRDGLRNHVVLIHEQRKELYPCDRCGKRLRDTSALKVHMLTHSKVKPFKCSEAKCDVAYTTKQCLQFHYKKVHGYTDDNMPDIVRSVPFTMEGHSRLHWESDTMILTSQMLLEVFHLKLKDIHEYIEGDQSSRSGLK